MLREGPIPVGMSCPLIAAGRPSDAGEHRLGDPGQRHGYRALTRTSTALEALPAIVTRQ